MVQPEPLALEPLELRAQQALELLGQQALLDAVPLDQQELLEALVQPD
jgi:hypothetical protein